jgi:hypothetical protein
MRLRHLKKKIVAIPLSLVLLLIIGIGTARIMVSKRWCSASWGQPFYLAHGNIAFPDANAAYWVRFLSASQTAKQLGFKIQGRFAHARYESFVAYVHTEQGTAVQDLLDRDIAPDAGGHNPFVPGTRRDIAQRSYTLWWIPEGRHPPEQAQNVLTYRAGSASQLILRIYAPDDGQDMSGGVGLPVVTLHDLATGQARPCTRDVTLSLGDLLPWRELMTFTAQSSSRPGNPPGQVHFWAEPGGNYALYQNPHNDYLVSFPAPPRLGGEVVVMRFKPPTVPQTRDGRTPFAGSEQVRYWSMCIGGASTQTSACVADFEAKLGADGYATLVVSDTPDVVRHATGMNLLPWGHHKIPVLIYRNLVTERTHAERFPGDLQQVLPPEADKDPMEFVAERFIGPYAPVGVQCTSAAFLENYCGVGVRATAE